jgi:coproporphyrinogen III oxidase
MTKTQASEWFRSLRDAICNELEAIETEAGSSARFIRTEWEKAHNDDADGGGGEMSLIRGKVFEKGGVNISTVTGKFTELMQKSIPDGEKMPYYWASGVSLVIHPYSPIVPAVHMNTRHIVLSSVPHNVNGENAEGETTKWWFGGGADLTPAIPFAEDTADFHASMQQACDAHDREYYDKYKKWCDEYFFITHRGEARGIGGIFYDYLSTDWQANFAFTQDVGLAFKDIYPRLVRRRMNEAWGEAEKRAQLLKRGRYAEFNLVYDRGTKFGLNTGGNIEAILMSLPPLASW